ncbi:autophagy-related protein 13-like [Tripterygium wilfordii]|uniref:Autophagy-related protein 13-like n=1 Tax=Tripterygium wilfordii TaxID=458696 RepID=A0A7J7DFW3_TRIWF|nr:autophagy-related protein 13b-like [Tripterygium wilfordii]XP_038705581.1 autophagy-related protein 13b-like [Tripterygium wilfordii]XP_038705582.1 autophagy-related protein 13b-like [Tripterygium wilfordii]XP_038705584.1 autophagy-related protein 13b-like [Tripterygium wilfordii]KAF5745154.1 autophagy-related protein 13-like [Tripterygium wilfordii]
MASPHNTTHSEAARLEQIITEFYTKSLHIILESRSPYMSSRNFSGEQAMSSPSSSSSSSSCVRSRDKWFNLALRERLDVLENLDLCHQSNLEPMVVDVILVQRPLQWDSVSPRRDLPTNFSTKERSPFSWNSDQEDFGCEAKSEKIIERWIVQYESRKPRDCGSGSRRSSNTLQTLYKKSILLLRSLYVTVRLLPAYKIFRDLNSSSQICSFSLAHKVSSPLESFAHKEEAEMQRFGFTPVDTPCGRLCLSVLYRSLLSEVSSEPSTPMSPQFIPDYVGSPLADPLKRFSSLPVYPPSLPFSRRHSWSYNSEKALSPTISFSPSPTYSEPQTSNSNACSRRPPPMSLPPHPPESSLAHKKSTSYDDFSPSPIFSPSPSPSPSPPIYIPGRHLLKGLLRSGSAPVPVGIPSTKLSKIAKAEKSAGTAGTHGAVQKLSHHAKDEAIKYPGVKIAAQISFSKSPSRSFQDDFDDPEFPCPFDVEDDDVTDPGSRPDSFDQKGQLYDPLDPGGLFPIRKSQDAAVGALVHMLKKAPPLRQDSSTSIDLSQVSEPETWVDNVQEANQISDTHPCHHAASSSVTYSRPVATKTTADALQELRVYGEMKNLLLSQGGRSLTSALSSSTSVPSSRGTA